MPDRSLYFVETPRGLSNALALTPLRRTILRYVICVIISAGAAFLLSKERFGETGGVLALMVIGATAWFCGPGPATTSPFVLLFMGSLLNGNQSASSSPAIAVVNLAAVTLLFVGIGWAGKLRRKALNDLREREQSLRDEARHKDQFLATLAHELRNPLSPLCSGLDILERARRLEFSAEEVEETQLMMRRQLNHLVRLIEDLLDINRINTGKIELRREVISIKDVVRDATESVRPQIEAANHQFTVRQEEPEVLVNGDHARLLQAVTNLLNNAAKFTPPDGHISLDVGTREKHVEITIVDSGIGIAPEALPRVFDMFSQFDDVLMRRYGGLGIGLNLSRRLVELHGGTIEAQSSGVGKGSQFTIRLPAANGNPI